MGIRGVRGGQVHGVVRPMAHAERRMSNGYVKEYRGVSSTSPKRSE